MHTPRYASLFKRSNAYGYDVLLVHGTVLLLLSLFRPFPQLFRCSTLEKLEAWATAHQINLMDAPAHCVAALQTDLLQWMDGVFWPIFMASALYNILMIASPWQATLGKRFCGIRVETDQGERLTLTQSALRHAFSGTMGIGFLWIPFTRERTALHDLLAKTRVVRL